MNGQRIGWLLVLLLSFGMVRAQRYTESERRWSLQGTIGPAISVLSQHPSHHKSTTGFTVALGVEYYLPESRFSLKAGYLSEEIDLTSSVQKNLTQLELGGRYYMFAEHFWVQAYGGLSAAWNFASRTESGVIEHSHYNMITGKGKLTRREHYDLKSPRLSLMPGIGLEIPLLSCLMLTVEYQFRMGLGANHTVEDRSFAPVRTDYIRAKGFRHGLNFGLKIDFPFTLTQGDGDTIFDWIFGR